jgi:hypothetical protein
MTLSSDLKNHHISILHYWNKGIRSAPAIHRKTNIPLRTIYYNINKLKQTNSLKHRGGNGRPSVLGGTIKKAIGQCIRLNNEIMLNEIKENLASQNSIYITTTAFVKIGL